MIIKKWGRKILSYVNKLLPKYNRVIIRGAPNADSSAISVANYISRNYNISVYYVVSNKHKDDPRGLLSPGITIIDHYSEKWPTINFMVKFMTSRYIFVTQTPFLYSFSSRQKVTNIWHGVLYKKVGVLYGLPPIPADITVGTSQSTRKMFSEAFGVSEDSVYVSGYPRNDMLLNAKEKRDKVKDSINNLSTYKKIAIWMPTYRKHAKDNREDGVEVGNPFYIDDFDINRFNDLLKKNNTLCLVKPHPGAPLYEDCQNLSNVHYIDDEWVVRQGVTLYELLGCTDLLISDVSSVIVDYMLLGQPIICVSTDFEEYRKTRGFYFEDIENWIPSRINTNQEDFFNHLDDVLDSGEDPFRQKRERLKEHFFDDHDANSTERLVSYVFQY